MGFLTQRFPDAIARGATGGPQYDVTVTESIGGRERRNLSREYPRHRYNVSAGIKTSADEAAWDKHFRKAKGKTHAFRFKDWKDHKLAVADSRLVLISGTTYQICKVYGADEPTYEEVRNLTRIVSGTLVLYSSGTPLTLGVDYTADIDTGRVTTASTTLTASCEFDVPCRYDFDQRIAALIHRSSASRLLISWDDIEIVEDLDG